MSLVGDAVWRFRKAGRVGLQVLGWDVWFFLPDETFQYKIFRR